MCRLLSDNYFVFPESQNYESEVFGESEFSLLSFGGTWLVSKCLNTIFPLG
jgi:hypothetical protein